MTPARWPGGPPWARFDDLHTGTAMYCPPPDRVLVAERVQDVANVLDRVQRATDAGRWAYGFVAYEAAAGLDPHLAVHDRRDGALPLVWFGIGERPIRVPPVSRADTGPPYRARWSPDWTRRGHADQVQRIRRRIAAGDSFQCNLTVRLNGQVQGDPEALYRDLAVRQRGAHNAYLDLGRQVIASASPELFFERRGDHLLLRPMKGTARRGRDSDEDRRLADELRTSPKERAENIMIVDLIRNDVGRIARTGSVRVPALLSVEHYETVHQLTSEVTAQLRTDVGLLELFRALFPSGSITGTPKTRSMQIIRTIEPEPRGVYCGAIGIVGPPEAPVRARFSVGIRTVVIDTISGHAVYGVGGGITWLSRASDEHAELLTKTAVLPTAPAAFATSGRPVAG